MSEQESRTRTVTLYDRPPVKLAEEEWPVLAWSEWTWHDGEVEYQANRAAGQYFSPTVQKYLCLLRVRDHEDGRCIVYGIARFHSAWPGESWDYRGGQLLDATPDTAKMTSLIIAAIREVGNRLADSIPEDDERDAARHMRELVDECVADLPAEEL